MATPHPSNLPTGRQLLTSLFNAISEIRLVNTNSRSLDNESTDDEKSNTSDDGGKVLSGNDIDNEAENELNKRRRKLQRQEKTQGKARAENGGYSQARGIKVEPGTRTGNILKQVPLSHRHLIITLHVLFPGLVLPALDLLDRGLVGRIILRPTPLKQEQEPPRPVKTEGDEDPNTNGEAPADKNRIKGSSKKEKEAPSPAFYLVRSAQEPTSRRRARRRQNQRYESGDEDEEDGYGYGYGRDDMSGNNLFPGGQRAYIVRLEAWNCTCAAFAFASFSRAPTSSSTEDMEEPRVQMGNEGAGPGLGQEVAMEDSAPAEGNGDSADNPKNLGEGERMDIDPPATSTDRATGPETSVNSSRQDIPGQDSTQQEEEDDESQDRTGDGQWSFGGLSLNPKGGGSDCPPLCKHLLACLLAERWKDALGQYVVERQVSKQEMAGIAAEI